MIVTVIVVIIVTVLVIVVIIIVGATQLDKQYSRFLPQIGLRMMLCRLLAVISKWDQLTLEVAWYASSLSWNPLSRLRMREAGSIILCFGI